MIIGTSTRDVWRCMFRCWGGVWSASFVDDNSWIVGNTNNVVVGIGFMGSVRINVVVVFG